MKRAMVAVKVVVIGIGNMGCHHARVLSLLKDAKIIKKIGINLSIVKLKKFYLKIKILL